MIWPHDDPTGTLGSENPNPGPPDCPRCGGTGYLLSGYGAGAPSLLDLELAPDCPDCDGTGDHCPPEPETPEEARALDLADAADIDIDDLGTIF